MLGIKGVKRLLKATLISNHHRHRQDKDGENLTMVHFTFLTQQTILNLEGNGCLPNMRIYIHCIQSLLSPFCRSFNTYVFLRFSSSSREHRQAQYKSGYLSVHVYKCVISGRKFTTLMDGFKIWLSVYLKKGYFKGQNVFEVVTKKTNVEGQSRSSGTGVVKSLSRQWCPLVSHTPERDKPWHLPWHLAFRKRAEVT